MSESGSPRVDSSQSSTAITSGFFSSKIKLSSLQQSDKMSKGLLRTNRSGQLIRYFILLRSKSRHVTSHYVTSHHILWLHVSSRGITLKHLRWIWFSFQQPLKGTTQRISHANLKSPWTTVVVSFSGTFSNSHEISLSIEGISCVLLASYCLAHLSVWRRI